MRLLLCALPLVLMLVGCAAGVTPQPTLTPMPTITPTSALAALSCTPPSPIHGGSLGPEVQGTASPAGQQLWGLLMPTSPLPLHAQEDIKIVWRMTGSGGFQLIALGPQGQQLQPTFGPEAHGGSNWTAHPGSEWGSGFRFPTPGCWDIRATRDGASGDALLVIAP
jgi:hypothetical protein